MHYCKKEDLRFEILKGISAHDTMDHEHELSSTKETLGNAMVNQRKMFVGIEKGIGKNEDYVLVVMRRGMMSHMKEWIRKNYGTKCVLIGEKENESSATLNREERPQK